MEVIEVTEREIEVIEVIERGPQGPQGAGITILTTQGDLLYRGATTGERLPIGTTGQVLKVSGGVPSWQNESGGVPTSRTITAGTGLTGGGDLSANRTLAVSYGTTAGTACQGNDSRLSDARTPTAHAASHWGDGSDPLSLEDITVQQIQNGSIATWNDGTANGSINTSWGISNIYGGSINTSEGGGSINTRGTGSIEFGNSGTRTTLTGTATADRAVSLPDATGTLALTTTLVDNAAGLWSSANSVRGAYVGDYTLNVTDGTNTSNLTFPVGASRAYTFPNAAGTLALTSDITKTAVGLGNVANVDTTNAANISSGVLPNARVNWAAPSAIGATTAAAGTFTTLNANNGTLTASAPVLDLSQTWNNAAAEFHLCTIGLGNSTPWTASTAASTLFRIRLASSTVFSVGYTGTCNAAGLNIANGAASINGNIQLSSNVTFNAATTTGFCDITSSVGCGLRLYNTGNASSANYERGFMRWSSNIFQIGNEAAGTGSNRHCAIVAGPNTYTFYNNGEAVSPLSWVANNSGALRFDTRARIASPADSILRLTNNAATDFDRLQFGGTTSSFPALKRSSTTLQVRLADDSADAPLSASLFSVGSGSFDGVIGRPNAGVIGFARADGATTYIAALGFDGTTRAFVANSGAFIGWSSGNATSVASGDTRLWRDAAGVIAQYNGVNAQTYRLYNTFTSSTNFERLNVRWATNECIIDAEAGSGGGTLRGIKLGSATSSLLGFYGATPATQPTAVADATDAATVITQLNALLSRLRTIGIIAT